MLENTTKKGRSFLKKLTYSIITLSLSLFLFIGIGELFCRWILDVQPAKEITPHAPFNTAQKDALLGWKMTPNYSFSGQLRDQNQQKYKVDLQYDERGFKAFGDVNSTLPKVFFVGDSYTSSVEVSNENTFYNIVKDSLDIEVFAYGHSGYSTLQELMILEKYLPEIQPDLIIWQSCSNDFIDNLAELEMVSGYQVGERRPYLNDAQKIEYKRPITTFHWLAEYSSFFHFIEQRWKVIRYEYLEGNHKIAEHFILNQGRDYPLYASAINRTDKILKKAKSIIPKETKVIGFFASVFEPQSSDFKDLFEQNGWQFTMKPAILVNKRNYHKETVYASDGYHWNNRGQELIAAELVKVIKKVIE